MTWDDVLAMQGMSSAMNRAALNNMIRSMGRSRILEVGSWHGSTAVAMCYSNDVEHIDLVDNFSEFGGNANALRINCDRFRLPATIHDVDWWRMPADAFAGRTFNVYFYDGPHEEHQHAAELAVALPHLEDEFLYIVDDYSWPKVRNGCMAGLQSHLSTLSLVRAVELQSFRLNDSAGYWNGMLFAWMRRRRERAR